MVQTVDKATATGYPSGWRLTVPLHAWISTRFRPSAYRSKQLCWHIVTSQVVGMRPMTTPATRNFCFFYGLEPRWFSPDRLYRVYVSDQMIAGAYIAGQLYEERSASVQLQQAAWLLRSLFMRRCLLRREGREAFYDSFDPLAPQLLQQDHRNFQLQRSDVVRTRLRRNRSLWTPFNVGRVELELLDGSIRRFILVGDQQAEDVLALLTVFDSGIEVTGTFRPRPQPRPATRRQARLCFTFLSLLLLGFGIFFGAVGFAGPVKNPKHQLLALANVCAAIYCLVLAWLRRSDRPPTEGTFPVQDKRSPQEHDDPRLPSGTSASGLP